MINWSNIQRPTISSYQFPFSKCTSYISYAYYDEQIFSDHEGMYCSKRHVKITHACVCMWKELYANVTQRRNLTWDGKHNIESLLISTPNPNYVRFQEYQVLVELQYCESLLDM